MDHSKMDMNDPIMQAMMKQCMGNQSHGDNHGKGHHGMKNEKMEESHGSEHKKGGHHN